MLVILPASMIARNWLSTPALALMARETSLDITVVSPDAADRAVIEAAGLRWRPLFTRRDGSLLTRLQFAAGYLLHQMLMHRFNVIADFRGARERLKQSWPLRKIALRDGLPAARWLGWPLPRSQALRSAQPALSQPLSTLKPGMTAKISSEPTYIHMMRPQDILLPTPAGLCCSRAASISTRSARRARRDHPRPFRPCPRRPRRGAGDAGNAGHHAAALRREFRRARRRRSRYGETIKLGDVTVSFHPAGHVLGSAQIEVSCQDTCIVASGDYKDAHDPTCAPFELVPCDVFITEATFGLPVFRHGDAADEVKKLLDSVALFPERAHLVGAYSLGKAQRVIALMREAGYDAPIYLHGAMEKITRYYESGGVALGELRPVKGMKKADLAGTITLAPPSATSDLWTRRFPDPVTAFASGWMRVRARARQRGVELPLVISDHADWDGLDRDHRRDRRRRSLGHARPGRRAGALVPDAGLAARPLAPGRLWRRGGQRDAALPSEDADA